MTALAATFQRNNKLHDKREVALPVKASTIIHTGAFVCTNSGLAVPGADTSGLVPVGVALEGYDNSAGANGTVPGSSSMSGAARYCVVDQGGEWEFTVSGSAPVYGDVAYVVDDNTVSKADPGNGIVAGKFTRAGNDGGWFVDVAAR